MTTTNRSTHLLWGLVLLCSCQRSSPWQAQQLSTGDCAFDSTKLCYTAKDTSNGIELEMLQMQDQLQLYFQVHSPIPAYQGHLKEALVTLSSEEEHIQCIAFRLEGGEKLLMPDSIRDKIIALLLENKPVTIELEGYKTTFQPADFKTHFKKLKHPFPISNPFRLPF